MSIYSTRASKFLRNGLEHKSNNVTDPFLSKLEDRINSLGQFIQQRHGMESYRELLNHIWSENSK